MTQTTTKPSLLSLKLPSDFKLSSLALLNDINRTAVYPIYDLYGSIPYFLPSSRASHCLPDINLESLPEYLAACREYGITFNYTINAIHGLNDAQLGQIDRLLKAGVKRYTVANLDLAQHVITMGVTPDISVVSNLISPQCLHHFLTQLEGSIGTICLPEQLNHNQKSLREFTQTFPTLSFELIVNSFCYQNCPYRQDHYRFICTNQANQNDPLESWCTRNKMSDAFNHRLSYIAPDQFEDIAAIGIRKAKLAGRELIADASYEVIKAWASGHYRGNGNKLLLLGTDNWYQYFPAWNI